MLQDPSPRLPSPFRWQRLLINMRLHSLSAFRRRLFEPVDISSLVFFRIIFGAIMLWEVWRYFTYGWIKRFYIDPVFYFTYFGFSWVRPWPGDWMYAHFYLIGALAACIMLGLWYRISTALFFLAFTYVFLLDQTRYLNHFYLVILISFLLIFIPAHRAFSIDSWWRPKIRSGTAPAWTLWILRAQIGIVYFYGGLAKLNSDWLRGEPMRMWLSRRTDFPLIGALFTEEWMVYLFVYGGLLFDLLIVPLLLWRRTRMLAFLWAVGFHLLNAMLFQIGIFPWFGLAASLLFFPPDWPRRVLRLFRKPAKHWRAEAQHAAANTNSARTILSQRLTIALLASYLAVQLLVPLRHFLYPGDVNWTEEGHRFSWHMKLRTKRATARFFVADPASKETWEFEPRNYLDNKQVRTMSTHPDMILQFSHFIAEEMRKGGYANVEIQAQVTASLNGRRRQLLIDPTVNLHAQTRSLMPAAWIAPLTEPLLRPEPASEEVTMDDN